MGRDRGGGGDQVSDELEGFRVGVINEPGYCEVCHHRLRVGSQAAIWRPTKELFCVDCAKEVATSEPPVASILFPLLFAGGLLAAVVLGVVR